MKKHSRLKIFAFLLAVATAVSCLGITAFAAEKTLPSKSVSINTGVKIFADGKEFIPVDSDGKPVEVFLYNGTTYLPVRGISSLFSVGLQWDNDSKTVYIGSHNGVTPEADSSVASVSTTPFSFAAKTVTVYTGVSICYNDAVFTPTDSDGQTVDVFLCDGTTYLPVRAISKLLGTSISWDQATKSVSISTSAALDPDTVVAAANAAIKPYEDSRVLAASYYEYYVKVSTVLDEMNKEYKIAYATSPDTITALLYLSFSEAYDDWSNTYPVYMDKVTSLLTASSNLSDYLTTAAADGKYTDEELSSIVSQTENLTSNYSDFAECLKQCSNTNILAYIKAKFSSAVYKEVEAIS